MNVKELIALLETCEPTSKISIYVPDPEDEGMEFVYEIDRVDRHWDHQQCTGKPNAIGIVATERLAQLRATDEETQNASLSRGPSGPSAGSDS